MNPIGGEIAIKNNNEKSYLTDSGRSSLRFLLRNFNFKNKKFLVPDFFCDVIETVLKEENIDYSFYHINKDLSIDFLNVSEQSFDVFYVINYFGIIHDLSKLNLKNKTLIEDNVFSYYFFNNQKSQNWFGFNSFRKISPLTDGSLIKTNLDINGQINPKQSPFSKIKKTACEIKYEFLTEQHHSEPAYLELFNKGEELINEQKEIFSISANALSLLFNEDFNNQTKLKERYFKLQAIVHSKIEVPNYFSFYPLTINNKLDFIKKLRSKNIFLPDFWPQTTQNNYLYTNLVVFPLFNNYTDEQFDYMLENIREHL